MLQYYSEASEDSHSTILCTLAQHTAQLCAASLHSMFTMGGHAQLHESRSPSQTWPWAAVETAAHLLQAVSWVCCVGIYYIAIKQCSLTENQATEDQMNMGHMVLLHIACQHEYSAYRQLHSKCNQLAADANDTMECAPDTKAC